jgi:hypothetical protein
MKELSLNQMEMLSGGGWADHFNKPSGHQVYCFVAATAYGFCAPPLGIAAGFLCLFAE